jgi:hypothetical protein
MGHKVGMVRLVGTIKDKSPKVDKQGNLCKPRDVR